MLHKSKHLEVYCVDHDEMCCVICMSTEHHSCNSIKTIEEMAEQMSGKEKPKDFTNHLKEIETSLGNFADKKQQNFDGLDQMKDGIMISMTNNAIAAKTKIDDLLDKFKTDFEQLHKEQQQLLINIKESIESFKKTVANGCKIIEAVSDKGNSKQVFITMAKVRSQLRCHMEKLCIDLEDDCVVDYDSKLDEVIKKLTSTQCFGSVEAVKSPCYDQVEDIVLSVKSCYSLTEVEDATVSDQFNEVQDATENTEDEINSLTEIEDIEAVPICEIKSGGSDFTGGVFLQNNSIMFADRCSERLKIYSVTGQFIRSYQLDKAPYDVAVGLNDEIYITFYESNIIRKYKVEESSLVKLNEIRSDAMDCGIVYVQEGILLASENEVSVINEKNGSVIKSFQRTACPYTFTCVSKSGNFYYSNGNGVICSSFSGKELFCHKNEKLLESKGIAVDCCENVYICCATSIYLVSNKGEKGRLLLAEINGIGYPYAIGFDKTGRKFFVTSNTETVTAKIYKLCKS